MTTMNPIEFIMEKREGKAHARAEFEAFFQAYVRDEIPDYQMAAWLMAAYINGVSTEETAWLTAAIRTSGAVLDCRDCGGPVVDKHSTGGVGDKTSIVLLPLLAACDVYVPMISGRGLGHTGGTLDKLEAIPGMTVRLPRATYDEILRAHGGVFMAQTDDIAPLDKKLYSLRDVTGTVESIGLITASIIGKKAAEDLDGLVLDVKWGRGAFMQEYDDAYALAESLATVGASLGMACTALLTDMNEPLGAYVGNSVEIAECIAFLEGGACDARLYEVTMALAREMYMLAYPKSDESSAMTHLERVLKDGTARERLSAILCAQGVEKRVADELPDSLPTAPETCCVRAPRDGIVQAIASNKIGRLLAQEGAGRMQLTDTIDPAVGMKICAPCGTQVAEGDTLAELYVRRTCDTAPFAACFTLGDESVSVPPIVCDRIAVLPTDERKKL